MEQKGRPEPEESWNEVNPQDHLASRALYNNRLIPLPSREPRVRMHHMSEVQNLNLLAML